MSQDTEKAQAFINRKKDPEKEAKLHPPPHHNKRKHSHCRNKRPKETLNCISCVSTAIRQSQEDSRSPETLYNPTLVACFFRISYLYFQCLFPTMHKYCTCTYLCNIKSLFHSPHSAVHCSTQQCVDTVVELSSLFPGNNSA